MSKWSKIRKDVFGGQSLKKGKSWSILHPLNVATAGVPFAVTRLRRDFGKVKNWWHDVRHPAAVNSAFVGKSTLGNTGFRRYT